MGIVMAMRYLLIGLVLLVLAGCGRGLGTTVLTVVGFSSEQETYIRTAMTELQAVTKTPEIIVVEYVPELPTPARACVDCASCRIEMRDLIAPNSAFSASRIKLIVWHEIGHCLGLKHTTDMQDIMYSDAGSFAFYMIPQEQVNAFIASLPR
jgi:hypothetical protein